MKNEKNMTRTEISAEFRKLGLRWEDVCKLCGTGRSFTQEVAAGNKTSRPVAIKLAAIINKPFDEVFPEYGKTKVKTNDERDTAIKKAKERIEKLSE